MAIFEQDGNKCYFIHIPRTGGRYVSSLFENSSGVNCKYHKINQQRIDGIDVTHLHYPLYVFKLGVSDIPHITVVRNPYKKIHSAIRVLSHIYGIDYNMILEDESSFLNFMINQLTYDAFHNNWFLPQHKFISQKTYVWKYEWGFGRRFQKWVLKKTGIKIDIKNTNYEKFDLETDLPIQLNKKCIKNIKNFYKKDYETFKYFRF